MSRLQNGRFRLVAMFMMLALALAIIPAASHTFAGTPANSPTKQALPSQGNAQHVAVPQRVGPAGKVVLSQPANPDVVLYDQYNNTGANAINSQNFEPANVAF